MGSRGGSLLGEGLATAKAPGGTGCWTVGLRLEIWVREKVR